MFERILVAVDGSDHSARALDTACDLASRYDGAQVVVVHVPATGSASDDLLPAPPGEAVLRDAERRVRATGTPSVSFKALEGNPARAILAEVELCGADLVVAGRRGLGALDGVLMGSVSQRLTANAPCAVLTTR